MPPATRAGTRQAGTSKPPATIARARQPRPAQRPAQTLARPALTGVRRPLLLLMVMVVIAGALISRLVFWQVMQHARLAQDAIAQHNALLVEPALRGQIYDASGTPLATDVTMNLLYAVPREIKDPVRAATLLAPILGQPEKTVEDKVSGYATYTQLAPTVTAGQTQAIRKLALPGIFLDPVIRRDYPEGPVAAHLLGFLGGTNHGQYGLEQYYDNALSGKEGVRSILKDTSGNDVRISSAPPIPSQDGANLYLSLDSFVQNAAETELQKAIKKHSADGGTIIVMDPKTGFILGMASTPSYDPNQYAKSATQAEWPGLLSRFDNPAIAWTFEPGSTFKIITMAAGLDTHVITPDTSFDDTGSWMVADQTLHNWCDCGFGQETMTQVLQHSANVGASFVSSRLGASRFYEYVKRFGIGKPTGIDLAGEEAGILHLPGDKTWTIVNQFTNSFGQGLATTPLQMVRAVAAVANGGVMMKPQLVTRIVYGGHVIYRRPVTAGRVISAQTAHTLTQMLVTSAVGGEAQFGLVDGYNIAAKTGTANIPGPDGGYLPGSTIASIVGYAPAYHPRFVAMIIVNHPRDTPWGSMAAAPVLHDLFQDLFMYYHIPPAGHTTPR